MFDWIRGLGKSVWIAIGMFLAAMAVASAARQKASAQKWKDHAVYRAAMDVGENIDTAKAALSRAKLHNAKAKELKEKARKRLDNIGKRDEDMGSIVSGWHTRRVRNSTDT